MPHLGVIFVTMSQEDELVFRGLQAGGRGYLLKESLADALDYKQPWRVRRELGVWLAWASRSKLKPFVKMARTIRKHLPGVEAYAEERLTNGIVERACARFTVTIPPIRPKAS